MLPFEPSARSAEKRLTAQEVHDLTEQALQAHFQLDMSDSPYEVQDIWDVVIAASVQRLSIESGCDLLEGAPSANTVRTALGSLFSDEGLTKLEQEVNQLLVARLPRKLLNKPRIAAIDITDIPYHGHHDDEDEPVRRGRAKSGTTHFHSFGTLVILHRHKRYTLAVTLMRRSDKALDVLKRLLTQGKKVGLRPKRLYLDRGFDNNAVVAYLKRQGFPCIIALAIRGKTGGTRGLCKGRKSQQVRYRRESRRYGRQSLPLFILCKYSKGHYRRRGVRYFAYILIGDLKMSARQGYEEYRRRFGIETT